MGSPRTQLDDALARWWREDARERVARWRGDPDALSADAVAARHAELVGPETEERFSEASARGLFGPGEREACAAWLRRAIGATARTRARARVATVRAAPVAHDSDWHAMDTLTRRMALEPRPRERRAIARSLEPALEATLAAVRAGAADREEVAERARWLDDVGAPPDAGTRAAPDPEALLAATDDAWAEVLARTAHGAKVAAEHAADLAHVLRAPRFDALFDARRRWRRLAEPLGALREPLSRAVKIEPPSAARATHALAIVEAARDVRVSTGAELGAASEHDGAIALGRALAVALTHPAVPEALARPLEGTVGRAIGMLFAHLLTEPLAHESSDLSSSARRAVTELSLAISLFALRTEACGAIARAHVDVRDRAEAARGLLTRAWGVELSETLALLALEGTRAPTYRALAWVAPLYDALRARFDEDWWRNPRSAEVLRAAAARGGALSIEEWAEELEARPDALGERVRELLR